MGEESQQSSRFTTLPYACGCWSPELRSVPDSVLCFPGVTGVSPVTSAGSRAPVPHAESSYQKALQTHPKELGQRGVTATVRQLILQLPGESLQVSAPHYALHLCGVYNENFAA